LGGLLCTVTDQEFTDKTFDLLSQGYHSEKKLRRKFWDYNVMYAAVRMCSG
jgi:hypothetical protein